MSAAASSPVPPAERLACLIDWLCVAIAARGIGGLLTAPLIFLLWRRLKRAALRARQLAAKLAAGQPLATPRPRTPEPSRPGRPPPPRLPRGYAWLIRLVPATAAGGSQLRALLTDPEMAALVHEPPMRRLVRPLCVMLGVTPLPVPKRDTTGPTVPPPPAARPTPPPPPAAPRSAPPPAKGGQPPTPITPPVAA